MAPQETFLSSQPRLGESQASVPMALCVTFQAFLGPFYQRTQGVQLQWAVGPGSGVGRQVFTADQWFAGSFLPRWARMALDRVLCSVHFREGSLVHPVHDVFRRLVRYVSP